MNTRLLSRLLGLSLAAVPAMADVVTEPARTWSVGYVLDDLQDPPASFVLTVSDSAIRSLTQVEVGLRLVGVAPGCGCAGEMFVSLTRDLGRTSILLNGVGIDSGNSVGFGYDGWDVGFRDEAANGDVHGASLFDGVMRGEWQPDGRIHAGDTGRPLSLGVFNGQAGNGEWRLNVADLELGGQMRLEAWSLTLTGVTEVPEASTWAANAALVGLVAAGWWRRRR